MKLVIVEIPDNKVGQDLMTAFKYMVQVENGGVWFGSNDRTECENYIALHDGTL